jgi:hypothetical protein
MDAVPDPLLLRKSGSAGNRARASGSVARNSDHLTTETVSATIMVRNIMPEIRRPKKVELSP